MSIDFVDFTPGLALTGGVLIGAAAAVLALLNGRIAGISGIVGSLGRMRQQKAWWRAAFVAGLVGAPVLAALFGKPIALDVRAGWGEVVVAGVLVGVGTRYASGCTSGHGVCGLSRGSLRSLVATATFMASGFLTVFITKHLFGG